MAINGRGYMLRGAPSSPQYIKDRAPSLVNQLGIGDLNYNSLNGSGWSFWTQTDWSGGFHQIKFKDNATFKDGQAVDVLKKFGEVTIQHAFTSAAQISGSHSYGATSVHGLDLLIGTIKSGSAKIFKMTSAHTVTTLSAYAGISAVNTMDRFKNDTIVGLSRTSGTLKTLAKYNGTSLSGIRNANPIVRSNHSLGIRHYTGERVASLSGDVLYYTTNLSTFTSAYQAGKNRNIQFIDDVSGFPYFFVTEGKKVDMFRWDEFAERAYPIYSWENLTNFGVKKYLTQLIITGTSNNKSVAFAFNGARLWSIFDDQLQDSTYDFSKPFEFEGNLQVASASWDGQVWVPGIYGRLDASRKYTPVENFNNRAYGYALSGTKLFVGYRDTSKYNLSGHIISSEFGSNIGGVDKLVNSVDINANALATGQAIEVYRSTDGGTTFTTIGKMSFAQDGAARKKTLYFPSGFVTKLWNYKTLLTGPGTTTPTMLDLTQQYRPIPDLRKRWSLSIDAGNWVELLNNKNEERDGKNIIQDLWMEMENKRTVEYQDVDAFEVNLVSAFTSGMTSAMVKDTRLMPVRGRMRIKNISGQIEEMFYTSADGGKIKGISRGQKNTLARSYTSANKINNYYNVIVTDVSQRVNNTDQNTTESIGNVVLLEV